MAFSGSAKGASSEINVTPLIDVLLVLLIIFMLLVPLAPRGLQSSVPQKSAAEAAPPLPPLVVRVTEDKPGGPVAYVVGDHSMSFAELRPALRSLLEVRQDRTLFIQADRRMSYGRVAEVVGEAREAGAGQVALQGLPEEQGSEARAQGSEDGLHGIVGGR